MNYERLLTLWLALQHDDHDSIVCVREGSWVTYLGGEELESNDKNSIGADRKKSVNHHIEFEEDFHPKQPTQIRGKDIYSMGIILYECPSRPHRSSYNYKADDEDDLVYETKVDWNGSQHIDALPGAHSCHHCYSSYLKGTPHLFFKTSNISLWHRKMGSNRSHQNYYAISASP